MGLIRTKATTKAITKVIRATDTQMGLTKAGHRRRSGTAHQEEATDLPEEAVEDTAPHELPAQRQATARDKHLHFRLDIIPYTP